jgi:glycosyltransferase involved in cell wall biosynthesis
MDVDSLSVVICTYNRAALLADTLDALASLQIDGFRAELIIVDNNSTDDTSAVVAAGAARLPIPCRYIVERQQGKSFALNTALAASTSDILALTDDDVRPSPDWLMRIVDAFRRHDCVFVCGKVLPRWECTPSDDDLARLAQDVWGPLALVDYGDEEFLYEPDIPGLRLPIGANLAFRREIVAVLGGWRTHLGKVDNSMIQGEDHEVFLRLRTHGHFHGVYDPRIVVRHFVPAHRLARRYFWRWFYWNGRTAARMAEELYAPLNLAHVPLVFGAPRFIYRQCAAQFAGWLAGLPRRPAAVSFIEELRAIYYVGFLAQCWRWHRHLDDAARPHWTR